MLVLPYQASVLTYTPIPRLSTSILVPLCHAWTAQASMQYLRTLPCSTTKHNLSTEKRRRRIADSTRRSTWGCRKGKACACWGVGVRGRWLCVT
eukprot:1773140-Rhodomonas_salina.1